MAASDSSCSSGSRWIGPDSTDGGNGDDSRLRQTGTHKDRQRQLHQARVVAAAVSDAREAVLMIGGSDPTRQTAAIVVTAG